VFQRLAHALSALSCAAPRASRALYPRAPPAPRPIAKPPSPPPPCVSLAGLMDVTVQVERLALDLYWET
jgi:hypothetical protein